MRAAAASDTPALVDLWVAAWTATMPEIDFDARRLWLLDRLATAPVVLVADLASTGPAGFLTLDPATGAVDQIAVAPSRQGRGVAGALLAHARRLAPGVITLDVNRDNGRALRFYRREGFRVAGEGFNAASGLPTLAMAWTDAGAPMTDAAHITIETTVAAPREAVFRAYVTPEDVMGWFRGADGWTVPFAEADLREGGRFRTGMRSPDGAVEFAFEGTYTTVDAPERVAYVVSDGRPVDVRFATVEGGTRVTVDVTCETERSVEQQREGWTTIMDNFRAHVERG